MQGTLNIFQRAVLVWNKMHPYNAVHIVRIPRLLDKTRLEDIINSYLESKGVTGLKLDPEKKKYHYFGGPANIQINIINLQGDLIQTLNEEVRKQLNMPFNEESGLTPFRFFAICQDDSFYLGLVYFHLIAGADSIIFLLKNIAGNYMNKHMLNSGAMDRYPGTYRKLLPFRFKLITGWLRTLPSQISGVRHSFRPRYSDLSDHDNGFSFFTVDAPQFKSLVETAVRWDVTLNDMFLGLLIKALAPLAEQRRSSVRRKNISIASIANIRKDLAVTSPETFSIFLGSFSVTHTVPESAPLEQIVTDVREQTEKIKKYRIYLRAIIDQFLALRLMSLLTPERQKKFYPKYYPLWAGITNVNLKTLWDLSEESESIDYIRAVSTGPVSPLVFSFTTVKDKLNIGVSYRTTVYSKADIDKIIHNFSKYIVTPHEANV